MILVLLVSYACFGNSLNSKEFNIDLYLQKSEFIETNSHYFSPYSGYYVLLPLEVKYTNATSPPRDFKTKSLKLGEEFLAGCVGELIPGGLILLYIGYNSSWAWEEIHKTNLVGSIICVAPLTWGAGKLLGENPSFWKTILGASIGSIVGVAIWESQYGKRYDLGPTYLIFSPIGAVVGANL